MFWNKKPAQPAETIYDIKYQELWRVVDGVHLADRVRAVIIAKGVIDLYPNGADKAAAMNDFTKAQNALICAIGTYDGGLAELKRYWNDHRDKLIKCVNWNPRIFADSHRVVEVTFYDFYTR